MEVTYTSGQKLKTSESSYNLLPFSLVVFTQGVIISAIFSGFLHFLKLYTWMENDQKHHKFREMPNKFLPTSGETDNLTQVFML